MSACDDAVICPAIPCPLTIGVKLTVTAAATGAPLTNATFSAAGATTSAGPCSPQGECQIAGQGGLYVLDISAAGFAARHLEVFVHQSEPSRCGCPAVETQNVAVALQPAG